MTKFNPFFSPTKSRENPKKVCDMQKIPTPAGFEPALTNETDIV